MKFAQHINDPVNFKYKEKDQKHQNVMSSFLVSVLQGSVIVLNKTELHDPLTNIYRSFSECSKATCTIVISGF